MFNNSEIPNNVNLYFITFNQYMWYVVAIGVTLVLIGGLYLIGVIIGFAIQGIELLF